MANAVNQVSEIDNMLAGLDALDALDSLDFETEEVVVDEEALAVAAQEELVAEEEFIVDEAEELVADAEDMDEAIAELAVDEVEEPSIEDIEADLKTAEREARLEKAALSDEEVDATKEKMKAEAKPKAARVAEPRDAINVTEVMSTKVSPNDEHWKLLPSIDADTMRSTTLEACDVMPKKTREKAVNLMDWFVRGSAMSVYTKIGMELLLEEGEISSTALRNRYLANPGKSYTLGTANAQTGQVIRLLETFQIISDGKLNADHAMIKRFKKTIGA